MTLVVVTAGKNGVRLTGPRTSTAFPSDGEPLAAAYMPASARC